MKLIEAHLYGNCLNTRETSQLFNTFYYIKLIIVKDRNKLDEIERKYIQNFKPPCNTIGLGVSRIKRKPPKTNIRISKDVYENIKKIISDLNDMEGKKVYSIGSVIEAAIINFTPKLENRLNNHIKAL